MAYITDSVLPSDQYHALIPPFKAVDTLHGVTVRSFCLLAKLTGFTNCAAAALGAVLQAVDILEAITVLSTLVGIYRNQAPLCLAMTSDDPEITVR